MHKKNPLKDIFPSVLASLEALGKAADKQMEESKYTADGVLLEKGLKVWCVDVHIYSKDISRAWEITNNHRGRDGWPLYQGKNSRISRSAFYNRLFASKKKATIFRIGVLKKEIQLILREQIAPLEKEVEDLVKMYMDEFPGPIEEL